MHQVKTTEYGIFFQVSGSPAPDEAKAVLNKTQILVNKTPPGFCAFSDLRKMELLSEEAQAVCIQIQQILIEAGVKRVVVILGNPTVAYQFKRLSLQSGMFDYHRYIDASSTTNWEQIGHDWLLKGIDPDAEFREEIAQRRQKEHIISG